MSSPSTVVRGGCRPRKRVTRAADRCLSPEPERCEPDDSGGGQAAGMQSATTITAENVAELGTILGIWAHPDDEAYLSAGLMALARDNGQRVVCVTATRGELGHARSCRLAAGPARRRAHPASWPAAWTSSASASTTGWATATASCAAVDPAEAVAQLLRRDRRRPAGHRADVRPGRHHRARRPPDGLGLGRGRLRPGRPARRAAAARHDARAVGAAVERRSTTSLGVYLPGYPVVTPPERLAVDLVLDPGPRPARSGRWPRSRPRPPGSSRRWASTRYTAWVGEECVRRGGARPASGSLVGSLTD